MTSSRKKVLVRTLTGQVFPGYLPPVRLCTADSPERRLDLLDLSGRLQAVPLAEVRWVAYVREFNQTQSQDPEDLSRREFLARPRTEGLWVRILFTSGDSLEGVTQTDLTLLDTILDDAGIFLTLPEPRSNTQRLFVPRSSMAALEIVAVVTTARKTKVQLPRPAKQGAQTLQADLFPPPDRS